MTGLTVSPKKCKNLYVYLFIKFKLLEKYNTD